MIGIMVEDYEKTYDSSSFPTFLQVRSSIRIALAGRVAEELLLGELNVGSSCANEDLRDATYKAMHLISKNGFSASYGEGEYVGDGLLVGFKDYVPANSEYFQAQAREFIKRQYLAVKKTLQDNLDLLQRIQKKLIQERLLLQEDLVELCRDMTSNERLAA
jgi:cell division protease FtsH